MLLSFFLSCLSNGLCFWLYRLYELVLCAVHRMLSNKESVGKHVMVLSHRKNDLIISDRILIVLCCVCCTQDAEQQEERRRARDGAEPQEDNSDEGEGFDDGELWSAVHCCL